MSPTAQYWVAVGVCAALGAAAVLTTRRGSPRKAPVMGRTIALILVLDACVYLGRPIVEGTFTARSSLPLSLCDVALVVAAVSCAYPAWQEGVELTYFWGLAGSLQAVVTPDLNTRFPALGFFEFVVGHVGIVAAAAYLVLGLRKLPRPGAVARVLAVTAGYTAVVGAVDALTGADYMYLANRPRHASLLSVLGPWPWYIASAAAVAVVLFLLLDLPFRRRRRASRAGSSGRLSFWA